MFHRVAIWFLSFPHKVILLLSLLFSLPHCCSTYQAPHVAISDRVGYVDHLLDESVAMERFYNPETHALVEPDADNAEMQTTCSGVWVSKKDFLTAGHCVGDLHAPGSDVGELELFKLMGIPVPGNPVGATTTYAMHVDIQMWPTKRFTYRLARVLAYDPRVDLALLEDESKAIPPHPITKLGYSVSVGEEIDIIGCPAGTHFVYMHGYVSALPHSDDDIHRFQMQAPIYHGSSGGPVFNANGELLGITVALANKVPDDGLAVHIEEIDLFLQQNLTQ